MSKTDLISIEKIEKAIYIIRGEKVMLDRDLAELYKGAHDIDVNAYRALAPKYSRKHGHALFSKCIRSKTRIAMFL